MLDMLDIKPAQPIEALYGEVMGALAQAEGHRPGRPRTRAKPGVDPQAVLRKVMAKHLPAPRKHERRRLAILSVIRERGACSRPEIGAAIEETNRENIRRDLLAMERFGLICRAEGGRAGAYLWRAVE